MGILHGKSWGALYIIFKDKKQKDMIHKTVLLLLLFLGGKGDARARTERERERERERARDRGFEAHFWRAKTMGNGSVGGRNDGFKKKKKARGQTGIKFSRPNVIQN